MSFPSLALALAFPLDPFGSRKTCGRHCALRNFQSFLPRNTQFPCRSSCLQSNGHSRSLDIQLDVLVTSCLKPQANCQWAWVACFFDPKTPRSPKPRLQKIFRQEAPNSWGDDDADDYNDDADDNVADG